MFGIEDPSIYMVYVLTFLSMLICVVYGVVYWNKGGENEVGLLVNGEFWEGSSPYNLAVWAPGLDGDWLSGGPNFE